MLKIFQTTKIFLKFFCYIKAFFICIKYLILYFSKELFNINKLLKCNWPIKFQIRASKIIINNNKSSKELYIFDRPAPSDYWELREKFSKFHITPKYSKINSSAYYQEKALSFISPLSLNEKELIDTFINYFLLQINFCKKNGTQLSTNKFVKKPYNFLIKNDYLKFFSSFVVERINYLAKSEKLLWIVPSVIEPWPNIYKGNFEFTDLSPVEFREAPLLHDLCYMLMKYELYGSVSGKNKSILPKLILELKKIKLGNIGRQSSSNLNNLAKKILSIVTYDEFIDNYILMMLFHCFVKYHATGNFLYSMPEKRLLNSLEKHVIIFNKIE
tara:strand:- start:16038 stop:17024 length:987 start_codon:yes stop_codon:yes gene_type:complete